MITGGDGNVRSLRSVVLLLVAVILANFGDGYASLMTTVALPKISETYGVSLTLASWVTISFAITGALIVMMSPMILQRIGLRRMFLLSRILLVVSSLFGLFAWNFAVMIIARLLQGFAAGVLFPIANSVVIQLVPPERSGAVLAINSSMFGLSVAVSPVFTGLLLDAFSPTAMFAVPLGIALITLAMTGWVFNVIPRKHTPVDVLSIVLAACGLSSLMIGFSLLTTKTLPAVILLVVGLAILIWFAVRQLHLPVPLLDLTTLRKHEFVRWDVIIYMTGALGEQAGIVLMPLYFERACGITTSMTGVLLLIITLCYVIVDFLSGRIVDRWGMNPVVTIGCVMLCAGLLITGLLAPMRMEWLMVIIGAIAVSGFALVNVPGKDVALEAIPRNLVMPTNSVYSTSTQIASSLSSALFVGILSASITPYSTGTARSSEYVSGFQHAIWVAAAIEACLVVVSIWYSRQMVKHGMAHIQHK